MLCQYNIDFHVRRGYIKLKRSVLGCQETADLVEGNHAGSRGNVVLHRDHSDEWMFLLQSVGVLDHPIVRIR